MVPSPINPIPSPIQTSVNPGTTPEHYNNSLGAQEGQTQTPSQSRGNTHPPICEWPPWTGWGFVFVLPVLEDYWCSVPWWYRDLHRFGWRWGGLDGFPLGIGGGLWGLASLYRSLGGLRTPVLVYSVPVIPRFSWALWVVGTSPCVGEDVSVGCENPAVPVWAGPWLGPGLMVPAFVQCKKLSFSLWVYLTPPSKTSAIAVFLRQKLRIWAKLSSINM